MKNNSHILVTGAAGMLAWHTIQLLSSLYPNYTFIGIDNFHSKEDEQYLNIAQSRIASLSQLANFVFYQHNICEDFLLEHLFEKYDIDYVIHLAAIAGVAESFLNPKKTITNNSDSFLCVLDSVRLHGPHIPVIYASSSSVYGNSNEKTCEKTPLNPLSPYGLSKVQNENIASLYSQQYGLHLTGLRFFTAYGEYNRPDMFIYKVLESVHHHHPINLYHQGHMQRDFTYSGDIAYTISQLISKKSLVPEHQIFNVGNGTPVSILSVVKEVEKIFNKEANIILMNNHPSYDPLLTYCDNSKITNFLEGSTHTNLVDGLIKTVRWYQDYKEKP